MRRPSIAMATPLEMPIFMVRLVTKHPPAPLRHHDDARCVRILSRRHTQCQNRRRLRAFATGLISDYDAVKAALTTGWSNAQVEGQVNRLKRQKYGRAKFDLLRQRVLHTN